MTDHWGGPAARILVIDPSVHVVNCDRCYGSGNEPSTVTFFAFRCRSCNGKGYFAV